MFAGTLGRSQFFVRSSLLGLAETAVLLTCVAVQHEAFFGPPGQGRYRLAATVFLVGAFFGYKRVSYAIRRNRDAGGGELLAGIYLIVTCTALALQIQALILRTNDSPLDGMEHAGLVYLLLGGFWFYLLYAPSAPAEARSGVNSSPGRFISADGDPARVDTQLSLAIEQAIAGERPIPIVPVPARSPGFLGSARQAPVPHRRTEFGRRGLK